MASLVSRRDRIIKNLSVLISGSHKNGFDFCIFQITPILVHHYGSEPHIYKSSRFFYKRSTKKGNFTMGRTARRRNKRKKQSLVFTDSEFILFTQWLLSKGWRPTMKMKIKHFPETGRGFMALEPISCGDTIVRIPKELIITAKTVQESGIGEIFMSKSIQVPIHLVLTSFLLFEKHLGEHSIWCRYISILPDSYTSPVFSNSKELDNFPTYFSDKVERMKSSVHLMYKTLLTLCDLKKCEHCKILYSELFSLNSFLWAWFTVNSRVVYISPFENFSHSISLCDDNSIALVPYLDLFNHANTSRINAKFNFEKGYELQSLVNYKKYDQIFIHYGSHDNFRLFLEYGFIIPDNNNDIVPLTIIDVVNAIGNTGSVKKKLLNDHCQSFLSNLYCSTEGLSWNCKALIYLLLKESSLNVCVKNVYAGMFDSDDLAAIARVEKNIISQKIEEIKKNIVKLLIPQQNIILSTGKAIFELYLAILNEAICA